MWTTNGQLLLVQDGKLYGCEPIFVVICKAALLPEEAKNHKIQKNETIDQLGQVSARYLPDIKVVPVCKNHYHNLKVDTISGSLSI